MFILKDFLFDGYLTECINNDRRRTCKFARMNYKTNYWKINK